MNPLGFLPKTARRISDLRDACRPPSSIGRGGTILLCAVLAIGVVAESLLVRAAAGVESTIAPRGNRLLLKPKPGVDLTAMRAAFGMQVLRRFPKIGDL